MIHVCFCFSDKKGRYSKFVGTAMLSIFENTSAPVTTHILHDNTLTQDNRDKFVYLAGQYAHRVNFYNVEELCTDKPARLKNIFPKIDESRFTFGVFYRLFIPIVLPAEILKVICLDGDIIATVDLNELWEIELGDKIFGVVTESANKISAEKNFALCRGGVVKGEDYFNNGVLMMNLNALRASEEILTNGIRFIGERPQYDQAPCQDILNYCFSTRTVKLPVKFNSLVKNWSKINPEERNAIYHYAGGKILGLNMSDPFNRLWMKYFLQTPWLDVDTIGRLYAELMKARISFQNPLASISATVSGKRRAFFVEPEKIEAVKKVFSVRENEFIIIPGENEDSIQMLLDTMTTLKGKYVFFIMTENFFEKEFPFALLTTAGFVEGVDFIKGREFWAENPATFNSYPIIKEL